MTEDEAKTKWCPFVRYVSHQGEGINRWISDDDSQTKPDMSCCIASDCMAWQEYRRGPDARGKGGFCGLTRERP